jgi:membrane-associated protease RseP (regulator of RpoE activity)
VRTAEIPAGQSVLAQFWRDGLARQTSLVLTVPPAARDDTVAQAAPVEPANVRLDALGLALSGKVVDGGVSVVAATGPSAKAGIVAGDLIEQVCGQLVAKAADVQSQVQALAAAHAPAAVLLVSGDAANGADPGPRWVPVPFQGK